MIYNFFFTTIGNLLGKMKKHNLQNQVVQPEKEETQNMSQQRDAIQNKYPRTKP